ncbi:DUF2760 domain-containing protein [Planctomycetes bacterium K23_9]|uniref:DUF2760 domain-containing protein n=1 Tax=Stieleria marina TaxID=1930275 RepID=A0A517P145_9BACT|nr:hypothetical protein K239x_50980 [Planctomycetes bacterium K23_9]
MGLGIALKAFSAALFNREASERLRQALDANTPSANLPEPKPPVKAPVVMEQMPAPKTPTRSDAITLLSTLQREARLVDLIQEDLSNFSDAQVGAAARPCLQTCASTLSRLFGLAAVSDAGEGATVDLNDAITNGGSPARYQWIGEGNSTSGKLVHQGWQATQVELPTWTGADTDANVIAPAQLQR